MLLAQIKATYSSGAESSTEHSDSEQKDGKQNKKVKSESEEEDGEDGERATGFKVVWSYKGEDWFVIFKLL